MPDEITNTLLFVKDLIVHIDDTYLLFVIPKSIKKLGLVF